MVNSTTMNNFKEMDNILETYNPWKLKYEEKIWIINNTTKTDWNSN